MYEQCLCRLRWRDRWFLSAFHSINLDCPWVLILCRIHRWVHKLTIDTGKTATSVTTFDQCTRYLSKAGQELQSPYESICSPIHRLTPMRNSHPTLSYEKERKRRSSRSYSAFDTNRYSNYRHQVQGKIKRTWIHQVVNCPENRLEGRASSYKWEERSEAFPKPSRYSWLTMLSCHRWR